MPHPIQAWMPASARVAACGLLLLFSAAGCHGEPSQFPLLPATAEGLTGTTWDLDGTVVTFEKPPALQVSGSSLPAGVKLDGRYTVHDGIIEITVMDRTRAGTWNGRAMVVDGVDGRRVS